MIEAHSTDIVFMVVDSDGTIRTVLPESERPTLEAALSAEHEGFYATEGMVGNATVLSDAFGPIPHGIRAHTIAAIESLPGGTILSIDDDEA